MTRVVRADTVTMAVVAGSAITRNTFDFAGDHCIFYTDAVAAGDTGSPSADSMTIEVTKTNTTDTYTVGQDVQLDTSTQKSVLTGGTVAGCAAKASSNTDTFVEVCLNRRSNAVSGGLSASDIDTLAKLNNIITDATLTEGHTGTTGGIFFADTGGAGSEPTEDYQNLFWDNSSKELAVGHGSPSATGHFKRVVNTAADQVLYVERDGNEESANVFYVGDGTANADLLVRGDGHVGIGVQNSLTNAQLTVVTTDSIGLRVDQNGTGNEQAVVITHDGTTNDAIDISANTTSGVVIDVDGSALTTGRLCYFRSGSTSTGIRTLVEIANSNAAADNTTLLTMQQNADGPFCTMKNVSSDVVFRFDLLGHFHWTPLASNTDTAVVDDTSEKRLSIQNRVAQPTNAGAIRFSNSGGNTDMWLVIEDV